MSAGRKYANLPDLVGGIFLFCPNSEHQLTFLCNFQDAAPDIYETPDLIEDNSTNRACVAPDSMLL